MADIFLIEVLPDIIHKLKVEQLIDKWFFLRYVDPQHHLRLRFHLKDPDNSSTVSIINQAIKPYVTEGLLWKVQIDTYQRELERYGQNTIELAESIFYFDSEAILALLQILEGPKGEQYRWMLGLKMIDKLLDDFEFDLNRKLELLTHLSYNFKVEFGFTVKEYRLQLNKKFRTYRKDIEEVISGRFEGENWTIPFSKILDWKSQQTKTVSKIILDIEDKQDLEVSLNNLMASYIHMMVNRLFRTKQRMNELVLYDMLERHYTSIIARNKKANKQNNNTINKIDKAVIVKS